MTTVEKMDTSESELAVESEEIQSAPSNQVVQKGTADEEMDKTETEGVEEQEATSPPRRARRVVAVLGAAANSASKAQTTPTKATRGRKRKTSTAASAHKAHNSSIADTSTASSTPTPARKAKIIQQLLSYENFAPQQVGQRVLSCGEGDALGHPGRTTTKKPRKVDIVEEENLEVVQVAAGGVHSAFLTKDGDVYMCGINEKGTVPADGVEAEGSTDEFTKITFSEDIRNEGKIVMLAVGASFTAALTADGSVIAWGNLRDSSGEIDVHPLLHKMKETPVVIVHHKLRKVVKIAAGENHLVMLDDKGEVLTFGDGTMGQLGRSSRTSTIRSKFMCNESGSLLVVRMRFRVKQKFYDVCAKNVFACGFWTIVHGEDGKFYSFGLNNYGQLGIKVDEATKDNVSAEGMDNRELRVPLPVTAPAYGAEVTFTSVEGVQHVVALDEGGNVYVMGKNTDNALGLGTWTGKDDQEHWLCVCFHVSTMFGGCRYETLQKLEVAPGEKMAGVSAKLATSVAWSTKGDVYAWGFDTTGQLGLGLKDDDDKMVAKPEKITSAHLDGYRVIGASVSDQHTLFLAATKE